jgi:tetratricopeptide (TPR) repeat protein
MASTSETSARSLVELHRANQANARSMPEMFALLVSLLCVRLQDAPNVLQRAAAMVQRGDLAAAADLYQQALRAAPAGPPQHVHRNLGAVQAGLGNLESAEASFRLAVEQCPTDARAAMYYAAVLAKMLPAELRSSPARTRATAAAFRLACKLAPRSSEPLAHFGDFLRSTGMHAESERAFAAAVALSPAQGELHFSHGRAAHEALASGGGQGGGGQGGGALRVTATHALRQAALLRPSHAPTWARLGALLWENADLRAANRTLLHAVALRPTDTTSWQLLGAVHQLAADGARAVVYHGQAIRASSSAVEEFSAQLGLAVSLPALMPRTEQVPALRLQVERRLAAMVAALRGATSVAKVPVLLDAASLHGLVPPPYLPYWLCADGSFLLLRSHELLAQLLRHAMPALAFTAPQCRRTVQERGSAAETQGVVRPAAPIRVGFVSSCFSHHTLAKMLGWVARGLAARKAVSAAGLARKHVFNVTLFTFPDAARDSFTESLVAPLPLGTGTDAGPGIQLVVLPTPLGDAHQRLGRAALDVLVFNDLALSRTSYFIAAARLAPVQVLVLNNGMTSGFGANGADGGIDYFVEADTACAAPAVAATHYTEQLVRFSAPPFALPTTDGAWSCDDGTAPWAGWDGSAPGTVAAAARHAALSEFELLPTQYQAHSSRAAEALDLRLYMCLQSPSKLHPAFDEALLRILFTDPAAVVVLLRGAHVAWPDLLLGRLAGHPLCVVRDAAASSCSRNDGTLSRVRFVGEQPHSRFTRLASLASVHIDPFPFGGGLSSANLLSWGAPLVTLPTLHRSGRMTRALYELLGMPDDVRVIASDVVGLVHAATALAGDHSAATALSQTLRERRHRFTGAMSSTLDEWARFLGTAMSLQ